MVLQIKDNGSVNQKNEVVEVEEFFGLGNQTQAEKIADRFEELSNRY